MKSMGEGLKLRTIEYSEEEFEQIYQEAVRCGAESRRTQPRVISAKYDRKTNRLILELHNQTTFIVPCDLLQGLADAKPELLTEVEIWSDGTALHWEKLDADFLVMPLLQGVFGGKTWMANLPKRLTKLKKHLSQPEKRVA
ncbi:MAG: DUF2442 domain-containing protein [Pyrinomonadaceae bacterium]